MLAEIYKWFTDGFDTADLKDAMNSCISNVLYFHPVGYQDATGGKWEAVGAAAAAGDRSARGRTRAG
jgi:hypothetical protein